MNDRDDDIALMQKPDKCPLSFVLPLVRPSTKYPGSSNGVLYQPSMQVPAPAPKPVVYLGNLFMTGVDGISSRRKIEYDNFEAVLSDGWRID